jgi:hypothetical protein
MKFELSQQVRTQADIVTIILALAEQLQKVSVTVDLTNEGIITATKIEASFASIVRFDRTILSVEGKEGGVLLVAEVSYRPSALFWVILIMCIPTFVAWLVPIAIYLFQKETVRSAIEAVFKRVHDEFEMIDPPGRVGAGPAAIGRRRRDRQ